ncbi:MAG: glycosyltransferase family 39 protein [Candidatus Eremiobacteraeota bacterium]|nr:glycosyltransferase family 39 protein [Candidatus Eremiobacteraeota bacterium]
MRNDPTLIAIRCAYAALVALAIAFGVGLRFYHLGIHGFGGDEGVAALHIAGYTTSDLRIALSASSPVPVSSLRPFRIVSNRGPVATIHALASEDSQHPPAYYVLAQGWERLVGSGPIELRLFSALLSLLLLPAIFWLSIELFGSRPIAWAATAVAALSPLNVEYAQQAREYAAWMVLTVAASALLLRALKSERVGWWVGFAVVTALGFYTHAFYGFVIVAQLVYACGLAIHKECPNLRRFLLAAGSGVVLASPWYVWLLAQHLFGVGHLVYDAPAYAVRPQTFNGAVYAWIAALSAPFVDLEAVNPRFFLAVAAIIVLEVLALVLLVRRNPFAQWWFLATLGSPLLLLQIGNFGFTNMPRYLVPTMLALQISVAWLLGSAATAKSAREQAMTLGVSTALLLLLLVDCTTRANATVWWSDPTDLYWQPIPPIAAQIRTSGDALVLSAPRDWEALTDEASLLPGTDRVWLATDPTRWRAALRKNGDVFLIAPRGHDPLPSGVALRPLPVEFPAVGYDLLQAARGRGSRFVTVTRLWRVSDPPR